MNRPAMPRARARWERCGTSMQITSSLVRDIQKCSINRRPSGALKAGRSGLPTRGRDGMNADHSKEK